jgi:hypothetical protein
VTIIVFAIVGRLAFVERKYAIALGGLSVAGAMSRFRGSGWR